MQRSNMHKAVSETQRAGHEIQGAMRGRYDFAAGALTTRWPFAVHEVRVIPMIAPEFQASFQKILTTTRFHFDLSRVPERDSRKRSPAARR